TGDTASGSEVRGLTVTGPRTGIVVSDARAVTLEDVSVQEAGYFGVVMSRRAGATLRGALIEQNRVAGVFGESSDATIEGTVVRANQPDGTGRFGAGIAVQTDPATGKRGTLSLAASLIEQNHDVGVYVKGADAAIEASVVRATQLGRTGHGLGIAVES